MKKIKETGVEEDDLWHDRVTENPALAFCDVGGGHVWTLSIFLFQVSKRKWELITFANTEELAICGAGDWTAFHIKGAFYQKGTHVQKTDIFSGKYILPVFQFSKREERKHIWSAAGSSPLAAYHFPKV